MTRIAVFAFTASAEATARRAAALLDAPLHGRGFATAPDVEIDAGPGAVAAHARDLFAAGVGVAGVCAAGVLIRALAPLLGDKRREPPVLALSEDGGAVVPLLGGHRGANALAVRLADGLGGRAAVTTAGEVALGLALDAPPAGWRLANPDDAKTAMAALLAGASATLRAPADLDPAMADWLSALGPRIAARGGAPEPARAGAVDLTVRPRGAIGPAGGATEPAGGATLRYRRPTLALGLGASRGCPPEEMAALIDQVLAEAGRDPAEIAGLFSLDLKADEAAISAAAARLDAPARFFSAERLAEEAPRLATPSARVAAEVGCPGVAEAAALAAVGPAARLLVAKRKSSCATAALAEADADADADAEKTAPRGPYGALEPRLAALETAVAAGPPGRPRGRLAVVGVGPGASDWRTPEASRLIAEADELVGYGLYLDLLGPSAAGKTARAFALGDEEARCRYALEAAGAGRSVALICSGDAGIYAMAALVFELLDRPEEGGGVSAAARRAEIRVAPGVSALQAAAARAGALLGHDFCAISLSDLLTPRETILARLSAAAAGDFVVALYNPVSKTRRDLLPMARDILLTGRPADTPALLAADLGRPAERLRRRTLGALDPDEIDMLTVVLIGSSASRAFRVGDVSAGAEGWRLYTPRGYARKRVDPAPGDRGGAP